MMACTGVLEQRTVALGDPWNASFGLSLESGEALSEPVSCVLEPSTAVLQADVRGCGEPILILVQPPGSRFRPVTSPDGPLQVFELQVPGLQVYELNPLGFSVLRGRLTGD